MLSNCGAGDDSWESLGQQGDQILKEINPEYSLEGTDAEAPILWPLDIQSQFIGKDPDTGKDGGQEEKGATEDERLYMYHLT